LIEPLEFFLQFLPLLQKGLVLVDDLPGFLVLFLDHLQFLEDPVPLLPEMVDLLRGFLHLVMKAVDQIMWHGGPFRCWYFPSEDRGVLVRRFGNDRVRETSRSGR